MAIKTAIIGLGIMGQRMLEQMILHPEFMVNTIWDPDFAACQSAQKLAPDALIASNAEACLLYTSPSPRDKRQSRMPSSA